VIFVVRREESVCVGPDDEWSLERLGYAENVEFCAAFFGGDEVEDGVTGGHVVIEFLHCSLLVSVSSIAVLKRNNSIRLATFLHLA